MSSPISDKTSLIKGLLSSCEQMMGELKQRRVTPAKTEQFLSEVTEHLSLIRNWMVENHSEGKRLVAGNAHREALRLNLELSHLDLRIINLGQILQKARAKAPIQEIQRAMNQRYDDVELHRSREARDRLVKMIKLVGHEWGINAHFQIGAHAVSTEGADPGLLAHQALFLVSRFVQSAEGIALHSKNDQLRIKGAIRAGAATEEATIRQWVEAKTEQQPFTSKHNRVVGEALKEELTNNGLIAFSAGWKGHAVGMTIHRSVDGKYYLYYCNRGVRAFKEFSEDADMVCSEIGNPKKLTADLLATLTSLTLASFEDEAANVRAKVLLEGKEGLVKILALKEVARIPKKPQKMGNCSWANKKGEIHSAAIAVSYDEQKERDLQHAIDRGTAYFKKLERFGRKMSLDKLLFYNAEEVPDMLSVKDHLRFLTKAWQKLKTKTGGLESRTFADDAAMLDEISAFYGRCPYSIAELTYQGITPGQVNRLKKDLKRAGSGAFTFIGNEFWMYCKGQMVKEPVHDMNGSLREFLGKFDFQRLQIKPLYLCY